MSVYFAVPPFAVWHEELWDTILDLSALLDEGSWVLVGGQATIAHALAHGCGDERMRRDPDALGRLVTIASARTTVSRTLQDLGFAPEPVADRSPVLRFRREPEGTGHGQEWAVHVVGVTELAGGDQALARRVPYHATKGLRSPTVPVPDLLSTVVYEAHRFAADPLDPLSHARDAAFVASLIRDPARERIRLTPDDALALRVLDAEIGEPDHHVWNLLPDERDARGRWRRLLGRA